MTQSASTLSQVAENAAMLAWTLRDDARWARWYEPDRWCGMVGLMNHLAFVAAALEEQLYGRKWDDLIWYTTVHQVAGAILEDRLDLSDLSPYYVQA